MSQSVCYSSGSRLRLPGLAALMSSLLCLWLAPTAQADFFDSYKRGLQKVESQEWSEAAQWMRKAIQDRSEESPRLPARLYFQPYIPYYHLGFAYYELNDCRQAMKAWVESERQGVIVKRDEFAVVRQRRRVCDRRIKLHDQALEVADEKLRLATEAFNKLADLTNAPDLAPLWSSGDPTVADRQRLAERLLSEAGQRIDSARHRAEAIERLEASTRKAESAKTVFQNILREVVEFRSAGKKRRDGGYRKLQNAITSAKKLIARDPGPAATSSLAQRRRRELRQALEKAEDASQRLPESRVQALERVLSKAASSLRQAEASPPTSLLEAAKAWLAADAVRVLEVLADAPLRNRKTKAHGHLLLAAAHFSLSRTAPAQEALELTEAPSEGSSEQGTNRVPETIGSDAPREDIESAPKSGEVSNLSRAEHLSAARKHVDACKAADSNLQPIARAFSPAFRDFFAASPETEEASGETPSEE